MEPRGRLHADALRLTEQLMRAAQYRHRLQQRMVEEPENRISIGQEIRQTDQQIVDLMTELDMLRAPSRRILVE